MHQCGGEIDDRRVEGCIDGGHFIRHTRNADPLKHDFTLEERQIDLVDSCWETEVIAGYIGSPSLDQCRKQEA